MFDRLKYYSARGSNTLYHILKDHLGSASVITNASGVTVSGGEQRYYPFGESRLTATMLTDKLFTGQREMAGLGIYHYQARFYSPKLGRFLSADTITPNPSNPQNLNRYSYVTNNPLLYIDPSGHDADYFCSGSNDYSSSCTGYVQSQATLGSSLGGGKKPKKDKDNEPGGTPPAPTSTPCSVVAIACSHPTATNTPFPATTPSVSVTPQDGIYPVKKEFRWGAVDWLDIGINIIGIGGDIALGSTLVGDMAGPEVWLVTEGVEYVGIARNVSNSDNNALGRDGIAKAVEVIGDLRRSAILAPGIGFVFNLINIREDFLKGYVDVPDYGP